MKLIRVTCKDDISISQVLKAVREINENTMSDGSKVRANSHISSNGIKYIECWVEKGERYQKYAQIIQKYFPENKIKIKKSGSRDNPPSEIYEFYITEK